MHAQVYKVLVTYLGFVNSHSIAGHQRDLCARDAARWFADAVFRDQTIGVYGSGLAVVEPHDGPFWIAVFLAEAFDFVLSVPRMRAAQVDVLFG